MTDSEEFETSRKENLIPLFRQHAGAFTACFSAFVVGNTFGWSSFANSQFLNGSRGFVISKTEASIMESLLTFGAALCCFPSGWITDRIGRKTTLLVTAPISVLGWSLLIWSNSIHMLYAGRLLLGLSVGTACVTAPVYASEICQKEIRGTVGSYFQMLLATGVLFAYVVGSALDVFWFSTICGLMPIVFGLAFLYFPETPVYHVMRENAGKARRSLEFFRTSDHDFHSELLELSEYTRHRQSQSLKTAWRSFNSPQGIKSLLMSVGLMTFQQMSGINAFIFNATNILERSGSGLDSRYETIIIGVMQLVGAFIAMAFVDRLGRVVMLAISAASMSSCTFFLGLYFYLAEGGTDVNVDDFSWVPVFSLSIFVVTFSVGFGAVPWMMMPELMPAEVKGPGISIACITNWISAFLVTRFFSDLVDSCGLGPTFWMFCLVSAMGTAFALKLLPETKGKSFDKIQQDLIGDAEGKNRNV